MRDKILDSPYVLALLVGVYLILFFISNNWFMFEPSHALFLFVTFSLIIFTVLSSYHLALSWFARKLCTNSPAILTQRLFVLASILVWAYLLRRTFLEMLGYKYFLFFIIVMVVASTLAWFIPKIQIFRRNIALGIMCLFPLGMGFDSIITAISTTNKKKGIIGVFK